MFKNREFRIRMVKTPKTDESVAVESVKPYEDPEQIKEIAVDFVKKSAIIVGCTFAASLVLNAACEIIVKKSTQDNED